MSCRCTVASGVQLARRRRSVVTEVCNSRGGDLGKLGKENFPSEFFDPSWKRPRGILQHLLLVLFGLLGQLLVPEVDVGRSASDDTSRWQLPD